MEQITLNFTTTGQRLSFDGTTKTASDKVGIYHAKFNLDADWQSMDSVSAVWYNDFAKIATVLDANGECDIPSEVQTRKGCIRVNLVGSIVENDAVTQRLTSYSVKPVCINEKIQLTGTETEEITASQFEQYVANVHADALSVSALINGLNAVAVSLDSTSPPTVSYDSSTNTFTFGIPRGQVLASLDDGDGNISISYLMPRESLSASDDGDGNITIVYN